MSGDAPGHCAVVVAGSSKLGGQHSSRQLETGAGAVQGAGRDKSQRPCGRRHCRRGMAGSLQAWLLTSLREQ